MTELSLDSIDFELHRSCFGGAIKSALERLSTGSSLTIYGNQVPPELQSAEAQDYFDVFFNHIKSGDHDILTDPPADLLALVEKERKASRNLPRTTRESYHNVLGQIFSYSVFSSGRKVVCQNGAFSSTKVGDEGPWSALVFAKTLIAENNLRYCPYCNAETVFAIDDFVGNPPIRSALDHFLPKAEFPYLAISLYNLVPSCTRCNSSLKHANDYLSWTADDVPSYAVSHPYAHDVHGSVRFKYRDVTLRLLSGVAEESELALDVEKAQGDDGSRAEQFVNSFRLTELYPKLYTNELRDFPQQVAMAYSGYAESMAQFLTDKRRGCGRISVERVRSLILSASLDPSRINAERLSKLKIDLAQQLCGVAL